MTMVLVMLCGFLPALNVVSEKEVGTIEQINVTPVSRFTFTLGKLLPYWVIGFLVLNLCMLLAWLVYGLTPEGSIFTIYIATLVFVLVVSGFGLVIFVYPDQQYAPLGAIHHLCQSIALLHGNHAYGLPQGKRHPEHHAPVGDVGCIRCGVILLGYIELPETAVAKIGNEITFYRIIRNE